MSLCITLQSLLMFWSIILFQNETLIINSRLTFDLQLGAVVCGINYPPQIYLLFWIWNTVKKCFKKFEICSFTLNCSWAGFNLSFGFWYSKTEEQTYSLLPIYLNQNLKSLHSNSCKLDSTVHVHLMKYFQVTIFQVAIKFIFICWHVLSLWQIWL